MPRLRGTRYGVWGYAAKVGHATFRERAMYRRRARLLHGPQPRYRDRWADAAETRLVFTPETTPRRQPIVQMGGTIVCSRVRCRASRDISSLRPCGSG